MSTIYCDPLCPHLCKVGKCPPPRPQPSSYGSAAQVGKHARQTPFIYIYIYIRKTTNSVTLCKVPTDNEIQGRIYRSIWRAPIGWRPIFPGLLCLFSVYLYTYNKSDFCSDITPKGGVGDASHTHHWNPRQKDYVVVYFSFGHAPCHAHRIRVKFWEISTFCSLTTKTEILHEDHSLRAASITRVEKLHTAVDARRRTIQLVTYKNLFVFPRTKGWAGHPHPSPVNTPLKITPKCR